MDHGAAYIEFLNGLEDAGHLSAEDLASAHPVATVIHRRAEHRNLIGTAWGGSEYVKRRDRTERRTFVSMDEPNMGMSCTTFCCYKREIMSGKFPVTDDLAAMGFEIDDGDNSVSVEGMDFPLIRCFHRNIPVVPDATVQEALDVYGKDDRFIIDPHAGDFCLYFNNPEHGILCLRREVEQVSPSSTTIQFSPAMFNETAWEECDLKFVKVPSAFVEIAVDGKSIRGVLSGKSAKTQQIIEHLLSVFKIAASDQAAGAVNALIKKCVAVNDVFLLPAEDRLSICGVFEDHLEQLFGLDASAYFDDLRPRLLAGR